MCLAYFVLTTYQVFPSLMDYDRNPQLILALTNGSPDWVNAIACSRSTLKEGTVLLLLAIMPTESKLLN